MITNDIARRRLGVRACEYIDDAITTTTPSGVELLADRYDTPAGVARTLTRVLGSPRIPGDGEVAYWELPAEFGEVVS